MRGGEGASGKIPDGGPPVTERQNSLDRLLIQNDQAQVCIWCLPVCCCRHLILRCAVVCLLLGCVSCQWCAWYCYSVNITYCSYHLYLLSQERSILGTAVGFPDAMRFKGAAPEIINSRCVAYTVSSCES